MNISVQDNILIILLKPYPQNYGLTFGADKQVIP